MRIQSQALLFLIGCGLPAVLPAEVTLAEYARTHVPTVYTVAPDADLHLALGDQTNNHKDGDKVLSLSGKSLSSLDGISKLKVVDNGKETTVRELKRLHLYLNDNSLRKLPAEFFGLDNVVFVYCYYNQLGAIPPQIAQMHNLEGMYFTGNGLKAIAPEVFTMTWLRKLQVSKNQIKVLPAAIGNLTELMHFSVADNEISVLPDSMGKLTKLRVCDLSNNRITRLPEEFGKVRIMHQLRICNNPIISLPAGFAGMPGSIDITGTKIDPQMLSPELRANIGREKR